MIYIFLGIDNVDENKYFCGIYNSELKTRIGVYLTKEQYGKQILEYGMIPILKPKADVMFDTHTVVCYETFYKHIEKVETSEPRCPETIFLVNGIDKHRISDTPLGIAAFHYIGEKSGMAYYSRNPINSATQYHEMYFSEAIEGNFSKEDAQKKVLEYIDKLKAELTDSVDLMVTDIDIDFHCNDTCTELCDELNIDGDEQSEIFEYGEIAKLTITVNEKLEIVGGKIIPYNKDWKNK